MSKLNPNPAKAEYMIIGHCCKVDMLSISNAFAVEDSVVKLITETKSQGVIIDENLKWDEQFDTVINGFYLPIFRMKCNGESCVVEIMGFNSPLFIHSFIQSFIHCTFQ